MDALLHCSFLVFFSTLREQVSRLTSCLPVSHSNSAFPALFQRTHNPSRVTRFPRARRRTFLYTRLDSSVASEYTRGPPDDTLSSTTLLSSTHSETHGRCNVGAFSPVGVTRATVISSMRSSRRRQKTILLYTAAFTGTSHISSSCVPFFG